jgi:hypothetical protein
MTLRLIFLILISVIIFSCNDRTKKVLKSQDNSVENIVNYVTSTKDNLMIELPNLYDSLTNHIIEDSTERLILVEALKKRDFKVIDWGRGNYPPLGPRIVSIKMKKGDCFCQIDKIYYKTISDSLFQMTERIRCSDSLTFYKSNK